MGGESHLASAFSRGSVAGRQEILSQRPAPAPRFSHDMMLPLGHDFSPSGAVL
jgi:hypothetical protein